MRAGELIGKCCYCGTKSKVGYGEARCQACGAPLRHFKDLAALQKNTPKPKSVKKSHHPKPVKIKNQHIKYSKPKKKKKSNVKRFFDIVEDIVDIFD